MKKLLSILKYLFFLGIGVFLVWWQFDKMTALQRLQFGESLQRANYWLLIPVIIMSLLSHFSRAVRWKILMEPMGYKPSTANAFYSVMIGYLANTFVPRAGEILKCSMMSRYEKIPLNKLVGTILLERAFDLICYLVLILITILIQIGQVNIFIKEKLNKLGANTATSAFWFKVLIAALIVLLLIVIIRWVFRKYAGHRHILSIKGFHIGLMEGVRTIIHLKKGKWFLAHTLFIWSMYLLQIYVGFSALSATSHLTIVQACSVLSLATLGMIVAPGGIGAFPLAVQEVLLVYNVDNVSFGWLIWGVSTGIILLGGIVSFILMVIKNKKIAPPTIKEITE